MKRTTFYGMMFMVISVLSLFPADQQLYNTAQPTPEPTPVPYEKDEFPQWSKDLRRAEVIMVGSFPFAFFVSMEIFDIYRYTQNDFNPDYRPWPVKPPIPVGYTYEDKVKIVATAISISACIALADYIIIRVSRGKKQRTGTY